MNRREVLTGLATLAAFPGLASCAREEEAVTGRHLDRIGIQLYTVRDPMAVDMRGTIERLAEIGYKELEFAGYYERTPEEVRNMLNEFGLTSPSAHVPIEVLREDPRPAIEDLVAIGHEYMVVPWLQEHERQTLDQYRAHAELFSRVAELCKASGLKFAYHNHEFEFEPIDGVLPMDLLLAETDPGMVKIELDLYWINYAGADPFEYFEKHPGRFPLCHVKDMAEDRSMTDVGSGIIDFGSIFAASEQAGFKHYYVERDDAPDSLASAANSFAGASKIAF